jgi:dihydropteroate synthase
VIISVDTSTPAVMREAARLGAGLINDVRALSAMARWMPQRRPVCRCA